jgi:hypothetical protein
MASMLGSAIADGSASMIKRTVFMLLLLAASPVLAQDIVGLEDCSKAAGPDKKAGCLQSNVAYLHALIKKNEATAQARLNEATVKLTAATAQLQALRGEVDGLKAALDELKKKPPAK